MAAPKVIRASASCRESIPCAPQVPEKSRRTSLRRVEVQPQRDADSPGIAGKSNIEAGVAWCRREELEIIPIEHVARPDKQRPVVVPLEARAQVDEAVAVDDQIPGRRRAGR